MTWNGTKDVDAGPMPRRFGRAVVIGLWFSLLTGLMEWGYVLLLRRQDVPLRLQLGDHLGWMAPAANLPFFLLLALFLVLLSQRAGLPTVPLIVSALAALATFALLTATDVLHGLAVLILALGVGIQFWRTIRRDPAPDARFFHRTLPVLLLLVLVAGSFAPIRRQVLEKRALESLPAPDDQRPNVLLIILDTVGARSLSLYGYEKPTTPYLETLADHTIVFDRAIATAPWTLPSHGSMFTGRLPRELSARWNVPLDDSHPTLAEELSARGYVTAGFVGNVDYGSREFGLARGFLHYEEVVPSPGLTLLSASLWRSLLDSDGLRRLLGLDDLLHRRTAGEVTGSFLNWLDQRSDGRPFFAFLNLFDAHEPYLPPAPYDTMFGPRRDAAALQHEAELTEFHWARRAPKQHSTETEWLADRAAYDGAIAYMDHELARLLGELSRRGILDNTLVIVTSDHGEQHGDHEMYEHTGSVYMSVIQVPLLIRLPGGASGGTRVASSVSLADLPATVMKEVQSESDHPFPGASLTRYWNVSDEDAEIPAARSDHFEPILHRGGDVWVPSYPGPLNSIVTDRYQYIHVHGGEDELYDLTADPEESENLASDPEFRHILQRLRDAALPRSGVALRHPD